MVSVWHVMAVVVPVPMGLTVLPVKVGIIVGLIRIMRPVRLVQLGVRLVLLLQRARPVEQDIDYLEVAV